MTLEPAVPLVRTGALEIARRLGISEKTVRNRLSQLFDKLGVWSRAQAIVFARDRGFVKERVMTEKANRRDFLLKLGIGSGIAGQANVDGFQLADASVPDEFRGVTELRRRALLAADLEDAARAVDGVAQSPAFRDHYQKQRLVALDLTQHLQSVHLGEFQVQKHQGRLSV